VRASGEPRRIRAGGHALRCAAEGSAAPSAPAFLCLHGLADALEIWDGLAGLLAERALVARYDQRGHGESDAPPGPYALADLAADALAVLDALGLQRATLVGHSMGGVVAMAAALCAPERATGLVLLGTTSQCSRRAAAWYERIASAGERDGLEGLARTIFGDGARRPIRGDASGIARVTRALASLHREPLTPRLAALACPALLLVGEKDPMGPRASQIVYDALPRGRATLEVVPGCGHWLHVEAPDVVSAAMERFAGALGVSWHRR
jgi:3-oxoadipate enol-lactonase